MASTLNGTGVTFSDGSTQASGNALGAIGTYIFGATTSAANPVAGTAYANMYNHTSGGQFGYTAIGGTWRCVTFGFNAASIGCSNYNNGLFVRIS